MSSYAAAIPVADTGVLDFPVTWSHIKKGLYSQKVSKGYFPELTELSAEGSEVAPCEYSIVIQVAPDMIAELREWLDTYAKSEYKLFGRFGWTRDNYTVTRECEGVKFTFKDLVTAMHFKLRYYYSN
jgi:hypothetical protein